MMFTKLVGLKWSWPRTCIKERTQGRAEICHPLPKKSSSDRKATATNQMQSNYLEACRMKILLFLVPFTNQMFDTFIVLRWATVALLTFFLFFFSIWFLFARVFFAFDVSFVIQTFNGILMFDQLQWLTKQVDFTPIAWLGHRTRPLSGMDKFTWSICNRYDMPVVNTYPSWHLVPSLFRTCVCSKLLRPVFPHLLWFSRRFEYGPISISRLGHLVCCNKFYH